MNPPCSRSPVARLRPCLFLSALLVATLAACDNGPSEPGSLADTRLGAVLGSVDLSLTLFPVDSPAVTRTVGLGPDGTPVGFALGDGLAAVPLGTVAAVAVVDVASGTLLRTVPLPMGSGATGVAFVNDSVALVANPGLGSVSPVNVRAGMAGSEIPVGVYPQAVAVSAGRAFVADGNLVDFVPDGPGALVVLDAVTLTVVDSVPLSGTNSSAVTVGPDGNVYVLNSGSFGSADASLSVVDVGSGAEVEHHTGFGEFPGAFAFGPDGDLYISAFSYGIAIWDPGSATFRVAPDSAVTPAGIGSASGLGFDQDGRLWSLEPRCDGPAHAFMLDGSLAVADSAIVGICPISVSFANLPQG